MCGISAVIATDKVDPAQLKGHSYREELRHRVNASLQTIEYRGPDARGTWISDDNRVALGNLRLAVIDLSPAGEQPLHNRQGNIHAVVNGEFYDHERIRANFESEYDFYSASDSELAIALYAKYGLDFLSKLQGEFALCLYDASRQLFIAARDRYGIKPLFWTVVDGNLLVASEAKAFLPLGWRPEWDVRSIVEDCWMHNEQTLFKQVFKIRPGHYMTCTSFGHIQQRAYWDLEFPNKHIRETRTEDEMIIETRERLTEAIRLRLRADVPVGVYLSGGLDSSIVAGIVNYLVKNKGFKPGENAPSDNINGADTTRPRITCFTVGFNDNNSGRYDEAPIARRTAKHLGVDLVVAQMDEASLADNFEDAIWHCENHNPDLNYVGKIVISKAVRDAGYKVVLTGDGSDDHFGGYWHTFPDYIREPDPAWPYDAISPELREKLARAAEAGSEAGYNGIDRSRELTGHAKARRMLNNSSISSLLWSLTSAPFADWTKECYGNVSIELARAESPDGRVLSLINDRWHPLHTSQYVWIKSVLANLDLVALGERPDMANSIEGRLPYLDHYFTEFVNNLPPSMKIRWDPEQGRFIEKWILREAGRPFISDEVYRRKKHPYTAPIHYAVGGPIHQLIQRLVTNENVQQLGFINVQAAQELVAKAFEPDFDVAAFRSVLDIAQWVAIGQRFGVKMAGRPW